jgi:hypothetical protein
MARAGIVVGWPSPNYLVATRPWQAILPGDYVVEGSAGAGPPPPHAQKPCHHMARAEEPEQEYFRPRLGVVLAPPPPPLQKPWHHIARLEESEPEHFPPRRGLVVPPAPPHYRSWHHLLRPDEDEDAAAWTVLRRPRAPIAARRLLLLRPYLQINA